MNQLLSMSIGGSSYFEEVNASDAERSVDFNLNNPPPSENMVQAGALGLQAPQQLSEAPEDECLIRSPTMFEQAMNNSQRNLSRRVRSRRNADDFYEDSIRWGVSFGPLGTVNEVISLHDEVFNTKDTATIVPVAPIMTQSEPEAPSLGCAICMGQLVEETSTKCGHIFCKTCIEKAIATQHKCPNCRRKLRERDTFRVHLPYTS